MQRRRSMTRRFTTLVILLLLTAAFLASQGMNAQIFGNVKNEEGQGLAGVVVTLTNLANNAVTTATTGKKKGLFRFLSVYPGVYQASFDLEGYQSYVVSRIQLSAEQSVNLKIKLKKKIAQSAQQE